MRKHVVFLVVSLVLLANAAVAMADETMNVSAEMPSACQIDRIGSLDFGILTPGAPANTTTTIEFSCSAGTDFILSDQGNFGVADGSYSGTMVNSFANTLDFSVIYDNFNGTSDGNPVVSTIYGTTNPPADQAAGSYVGTIVFRVQP